MKPSDLLALKFSVFLDKQREIFFFVTSAYAGLCEINIQVICHHFIFI